LTLLDRLSCALPLLRLVNVKEIRATMQAMAREMEKVG
jgi:hypothetical protein